MQNAITNAQWYDQSGVQYSIPVNGPATGNANAMIMINSPIGRSNFSIMSMTNARYNQSTSYIGTTEFQNAHAGKYYDPATANFNYEQFHNDFPDLGETDLFTKNNTVSAGFMQMLRLTYRNDVIELIAGGRTNMSKSWYTMTTVNQKATWTNNASFEMNWTLPFGMNLITDINPTFTLFIPAISSLPMKHLISQRHVQEHSSFAVITEQVGVLVGKLICGLVFGMATTL